MSIKTILWASDGSEESLDALRWVELFATRYDANVIALSVFETANLNPSARPDDLRKEIYLIDSEITKKEARRLTQIRDALERKGIKAATHVATGGGRPNSEKKRSKLGGKSYGISSCVVWNRQLRSGSKYRYDCDEHAREERSP
jgi:nucleotide-binding universal stress UspA family protein